jgi:hypothetical protein
VSGLPAGLSFNRATGLITGTIAAGAGNLGTYNTTVTVTDGTSSVSEGFLWNVASGITITPIGTQQNTEGDTVTLNVQATDLVSNARLSYSATGLPTGASINPTTGAITGTIAAGAGNATPYSTTVTVSDGTSSVSQTFTWNVASGIAIAPIATQQNTEGDSVTLQVYATDLDSSAILSFSASGLPTGLSINRTTGAITGTIAAGAGNDPSYNTAITVSDGIRTVSESFVWNIASAISITAIADQQNTEGDSVSLQVHATDGNNASSANGVPTALFSASGLPTGLSINRTTGLITGIVAAGAGNVTPYSTTITASDGRSSSSASFTWNIASRITITPIADQQNTEGDSVSLQVQATDLHSGELSYSASGLPTGLSINPATGAISGTIAAGAGNIAPYSTTVTVSDGTSSVSTTFTWNVASSITITSIADQQNTEGDTVNLQVQATDLNSSATLSFSASGLPTGLSINTSTGLISGTIVAGAGNVMPSSTTITVSDGTSSSSVSLVWDVASSITMTPIGGQQNTEGDSVSLQVQATDLNSGATLNYSVSGLPTGLSINRTTGLISGTIAAGAGNLPSYTTTVTVSDGTSTVSLSFTWNVASSITVTAIANQQNQEGDQISLQVVASDRNSNATLFYSATGLPLGLSINRTTGTITGTIAAGDANGSPYTVTIMVSDGTSSVLETFTWSVSRRSNH